MFGPNDKKSNQLNLLVRQLTRCVTVYAHSRKLLYSYLPVKEGALFSSRADTPSRASSVSRLTACSLASRLAQGTGSQERPSLRACFIDRTARGALAHICSATSKARGRTSAGSVHSETKPIFSACSPSSSSPV